MQLQGVCHDTLDFVSVPGFPSAIRAFALTHSRRIVFNDAPWLISFSLDRARVNPTVKQIRVIVTGIAHVSTTGINLTEAMDLSLEARRNRLKIIEGALSVENQLEAVILHYFFGSSHERRAAFESLVLNSDWCSFAAKRKLIAHIIAEQNLLEGRDKNDFDKFMRDVMSVRNAFAHGRLSSDDKRVWLSFFEGTPRKEELTDDYLTRVETLLRTGFDKAFELAVKIGATKPAENPSKPI